MEHYIQIAARYVRSHIHEISFGITAVTMVLLGPTINGTLKHVTKSFHWLLRYILFILLCSVGYVFLSQVFFFGLKKWFAHLNNLYLIVWIAAIYLVIAWFAKAQKEI